MFQGLFRYVVLVDKKVMDYFRFFSLKTGLFSALKPTLCIKKSAMTKKTTQGSPNAPPQPV